MFTLPDNTVYWSYYLGVGQDSEKIFKDAEEKAKRRRAQIKTVTQLGSTLFAADPSGSLALALLALTGYSEFGVPEKADNIQYWFTDEQNSQAFLNKREFTSFEKGNGPLCNRRLDEGGKDVFLCLINDNLIEGIDVHLRVAAITVTEHRGTRQVKKYKLGLKKEPYLTD